METNAANLLLREIEVHPSLDPKSAILPQLNKLYTPCLRGDGVIRNSTVQGKIAASLQRHRKDNEQRIRHTFVEALKITTLEKSGKIAKKLVGEIAQSSESDFDVNDNNHLASLEQQSSEQTLHIKEMKNRHSLFSTNALNIDLDLDTFKELIQGSKLGEKALHYWQTFLHAFPKFKSAQADQLLNLLKAAKNFNLHISNLLNGKNIDESDAILEKEGHTLANQLRDLSDGEAFLFEGTYGPKIDSLKMLFRVIQLAPSSVTEGMPDLLQNQDLFKDPVNFISRELRKLLEEHADNLPAEQKQILAYISEDPTRNIHILSDRVNNPHIKALLEKAPFRNFFEPILRYGVLGNIDRFFSSFPSAEALQVMQLLTNTPGIESYMVAGFAFTLFGMMRLGPSEEVLKVVRFIGDNATRFAHEETKQEALDELETLIKRVIKHPIEDITQFATTQLGQFSRILNRDLDTCISEAIYRATPLDSIASHSPYWITFTKESDRTATLLIYSTGPALNDHNFNNSNIQWPRRISNVSIDKLTPQFFQRLLMHRYKAEYDAEFVSQTDDLFGKDGLLETLRSTTLSQQQLESRPFYELFDTEKELLEMATSSGNQYTATLMMQLQAVNDFIRPFQEESGTIVLDHNHTIHQALENSLKSILENYKVCKKELSPDQKDMVEWTIYELREALTEAKERYPIEANDRTHFPPFLMRYIKDALLAVNVSPDQILEYGDWLGWLLGEETQEALELTLNSVSKATATSNSSLVDKKKKAASEHLDSIGNENLKRITTLLVKMANNIDESGPAEEALQILLHQEQFEKDPNSSYDAVITLLRREEKRIAFDSATLTSISKELETLPKSSEATLIKGYLNSFVSEMRQNQDSVRTKDLDLARIVAMRFENENPGTFKTLITSLNTLRLEALELRELRHLKSELFSLEKYRQQDRIHQNAMSIFDHLLTTNSRDHGATLKIQSVKGRFAKLEQATVSRRELYEAKKALKSLAKALPEQKEDLTKLYGLLRERVTVETRFTPSKGWFRDAVSSIYVQAVIHLLNITLSLEHWLSPLTFLWLYAAIIAILPKTIGDFIDHYCKIALRFLLQKLFFGAIKLAADKGFVEPAAVETIFASREQLKSVSASITGKRRVHFDLPKPIVTTDPNRQHLADSEAVRSLLLPLSRFTLFNEIAFEKNQEQLTKITFTPFNLSFSIGEDLKAKNEELFYGYHIAENQENSDFIRYGSYLLLDGTNERKKVLLPTGSDPQALLWRLIEHFGPVTGLLGNAMGIRIPFPHRTDANTYFSYDVDSKGRLTSQDPKALAHLLTIEALIGKGERVNHALHQLTVVLNRNTNTDYAALERYVWPLAVAPSFLQEFLTMEQLGCIYSVRQQLFALIQERINAQPEPNPETDGLMVAALYQDLFYLRNHQEANRSGTIEERDYQEWLLYQSYFRHLNNLKELGTEHFDSQFKSWIDSTANILAQTALSPLMAERYRSLEQKFGNRSIGMELLHFGRDAILAPLYVPQRTFAAASNFNAISILGSTETEEEITQYRNMSALFRATKSGFDFAYSLQNETSNSYKKLAPITPNSLDLTAPLTRESFDRHFLNFYTIAMGEEGKARRQQLKQLLEINRGGWDQQSRMRINALINLANPIIDLPLINVQRKLGDKLEFPNASTLESITFSAQSHKDLSNDQLETKLVELSDEIAKREKALISIQDKARDFNLEEVLKLLFDDETFIAKQLNNSLRTKNKLRHHKTHQFVKKSIAKLKIELASHKATLESRKELDTFIDYIVTAGLGLSTARHAIEPIKQAGKWFVMNPLLGMAGGRIALYDWWGIPASALISKMVNARFDAINNIATNVSDFFCGKIEEDESSEAVLSLDHSKSLIQGASNFFAALLSSFAEEVFTENGTFKAGWNLLKLHRALANHQSALRQSFERDKEKLMRLVNPIKPWDQERQPVTYSEMIRNLMTEDFEAIAEETALSREDLFYATLSLLVKETQLKRLSLLTDRASKIDPSSPRLAFLLENLHLQLTSHHKPYYEAAASNQELLRFVAEEHLRNGRLSETVQAQVSNNIRGKERQLELITSKL